MENAIKCESHYYCECNKFQTKLNQITIMFVYTISDNVSYFLGSSFVDVTIIAPKLN